MKLRGDLIVMSAIFGLVFGVIAGVMWTAHTEAKKCHLLLDRARTYQDTLGVAKLSERCLLTVTP
jgi:hypothetical protein